MFTLALKTYHDLDFNYNLFILDHGSSHSYFIPYACTLYLCGSYFSRQDAEFIGEQLEKDLRRTRNLTPSLVVFMARARFCRHVIAIRQPGATHYDPCVTSGVIHCEGDESLVILGSYRDEQAANTALQSQEVYDLLARDARAHD